MIIPTATRPITLPDLNELPPHLAAKLRAMNPAQLTDILNPTETEGMTK